MTVTQIDQNGVHCAWIDTSHHPQYGIYPASSLELLPDDYGKSGESEHDWDPLRQ